LNGSCTLLFSGKKSTFIQRYIPMLCRENKITDGGRAISKKVSPFAATVQHSIDIYWPNSQYTCVKSALFVQD